MGNRALKKQLVAIFSEWASWRGGKNELILQKKIIRLAFFGSFFGNEKKNKTKWMELKTCCLG